MPYLNARFMLPGLLLAAILPMTANAQNFQWQASAFNDPANQGKYTAFLTQGVPETDNRMFSATCTPGSSATFAATVFGYNTAALKPNTNVTLEFFANGRRVYQMPGFVYRSAQEEGLSGVFVRAGVDDELWQVLSRYNYIRYQANGLGLAGMNLSGSSNAIAKFLGDCRGIFGLAAADDERNNEENNVASAKSCRHFGTIKSRNSGIPVTIRFKNGTRGYRTVMWLDYNGQPVEYKNLNPGESYVQKTFVDHPWMMTDGPGNCKEVFIPSRNSKSYEIYFDN